MKIKQLLNAAKIIAAEVEKKYIDSTQRGKNNFLIQWAKKNKILLHKNPTLPGY